MENLNCFSSLSSRGKKWVTSLLEHGELVARQPVLKRDPFVGIKSGFEFHTEEM